jgi:hypothetical protein
MTYSYEESTDSYGFINKTWTDGGKLHRVDGPAWIVCHDNGLVKINKYYVSGVLHRKDGPAITHHSYDGILLLERYVTSGNALGFGRVGFWALWETLDESERRNPLLLKTLIQYS